MAIKKCVLNLEEHRKRIIAAQAGQPAPFEDHDSNAKHKRATKTINRALRVSTYGIFVAAMQVVT